MELDTRKEIVGHNRVSTVLISLYHLKNRILTYEVALCPFVRRTEVNNAILNVPTSR